MRGEGDPDFEEPLVSMGEATRRHLRPVREANRLQDGSGLTIEIFQPLCLGKEVEPVLTLRLYGDPHIFEDGKLLEYADDLEGS